MGTLPYCSPEVLRGQPYNYKTDVWALGCILYELVTSKRAFDEVIEDNTAMEHPSQDIIDYREVERAEVEGDDDHVPVPDLQVERMDPPAVVDADDSVESLMRDNVVFEPPQNQQEAWHLPYITDESSIEHSDEDGDTHEASNDWFFEESSQDTLQINNVSSSQEDSFTAHGGENIREMIAEAERQLEEEMINLEMSLNTFACWMIMLSKGRVKRVNFLCTPLL